MIDVTVPKTGLEAADVTVIDILVAVGDHVDDGQAIAEIESDKVTFELCAHTRGRVVAVLVEPGDDAQVGAVIVQIEPTDV